MPRCLAEAALAASSPFVQRNDTLFNSARLNSVSAFPLSGRAPFLLKWTQFEDYFAKNPVTDESLKTAYEFNAANGKIVEYKVRHILINDLPKAEAIAARLAKEGGGLISIYYHPCEWVHKQFWDGVNFSRGYPRYNPGEFTGPEMLARGEVDACLIVGGETAAEFPRTRAAFAERLTAGKVAFPGLLGPLGRQDHQTFVRTLGDRDAQLLLGLCLAEEARVKPQTLGCFHAIGG